MAAAVGSESAALSTAYCHCQLPLIIMNTPLDIVTTLDDLMRFEYLAQGENILPRRNIYSILAGAHSAKMRGRGLDFEEVRQYAAGDDIRNIDWRVTARTGSTYSKVFNEEKERPSFILLDQSIGMFFGSKRFTKSVIAAHVAALSAFFTIHRGDRVGGLVFNEENYDYVVPKRSKALVQHFLQLIVEKNKQLPLRKKVAPHPTLLNEMLQRTSTIVTHDYVIAVVSDLTLVNSESKRYLKNMAAHNNVIFIHVEDPLDVQLPDGKLVLTDGRRQISWDNSKNHWGQRFTNDYRSTISTLTEELRHYGIPVSVMSTAYTVEEQIKERVGSYMNR